MAIAINTEELETLLEVTPSWRWQVDMASASRRS